MSRADWNTFVNSTSRIREAEDAAIRDVNATYVYELVSEYWGKDRQ